MEKRINLVMTLEDYQIILAKSKELGLSVSAYMRLASLKFTVN